MDPTNYWGTQSPIQPVTAGIDAYQQQQAASAQRALAAQQIQQQQRQQALSAAALQDALTNPNPTTYRALALVDPSRTAAVKQAYDGLDEETQRQSLQDLTAFHNYHAAGRPDDANAIIQQHIEAARKAGQPTATWEALQKLDPKQAQVAAGMMLSTIGGADKMASAYSTLGKEGRDAAGFQTEQDLKRAQANYAQAQADKLNNPPPQIEVNPQTGAYYNKNGPAPASSLSSTSGALDGVVQQIIQSESRGNPTATNGKSSATGAGQFLSGTWVPLIKQIHPELAGKSDQELLDLRKNPNLAAEATAAYAQDNAAKLSAAGLTVSSTTIAMAHKLGPQGAQAVLTADANAPLSSVLPADVIKANPQLGKLTAGQYAQGLAKDFGNTPIDLTPGDPNASGADFLRTLAPGRAKMVKPIADGDLSLSSVAGRNPAQKQLLAQQVLQYDPTASEINLDSRKKTREQFTSGQEARAINSINTVTGHLVGLDNAVDKLANTGIPVLNATAQVLGKNLGNKDTQKALADFNFFKTAVANELTKVFRGSNGAEADVQGWIKELKSADSPTSLHTTVRAMIDGMKSRLESLGQQYNQGMGKTSDPLQLISPHAREQLASLEAKYGGQKQDGGPPQQAVQLLQSNPALAAQFDAKYGPGASAQYLKR